MLDFSGIGIGGKVRYEPQAKQKIFHNAILNRSTNGYRDFLYGGAAKGGKEIPLTSLIPTPYGYSLMKDIHVGDKVLSSNGLPVEVIWESEVDYTPDSYEIKFDTGEVVQADARHLWVTFSEKERVQILRRSDAYRKHRKAGRASRAKQGENVRISSQKNVTLSNKNRKYDYLPIPTGTVRTTQELFETQRGSRNRANHTIRNSAPLDLPAKELSIDPYLLGLWLGDGSSYAGSIGMMVSDFDEIIGQNGFDISHSYFPKKYNQPFVHHTFTGLTKKLKALDLIKNKRIPIDYLRASYLQRVALLQGIMDTDGHCDKRGRCEIGLSKKDLAEDVQELICSLGIKCGFNVKELSKKNPNHNDSYRMQFVTEIPMFRLQRKLERQNLCPSEKTKHRSIVKIEKCEPVPMKCIQVENEDGMYLIGRTFIPTHNSHALRWEAHRNCLEFAGIRGLLVRSSFPELERTHLSRLSVDLPPEIGKYNSQTHTYKYSNGSVLEFGYGDRKSDFDQYLSAEYDFILIDELTTIPFNFSYLLRSRLAGSRKDFIPFWACATNPGSVAHAEVKKYFITKRGLSEEEFPEYNSEEIFFIPATVYDNQVMLKRDPSVLTRLKQMSKKDQQKFLYGNWDIFEGQFFDEFFADLHVVKPANYLSYEQLLQFNTVAGMDYGNYSAVEYQAMDYNGNVIVFDEWTDIRSVRAKKVSTLKKFVTDRGLGGVRIEADTNMWIPDQFDATFTKDPASDFLHAGLVLSKVSKHVGKAMDNRNYRIACNDAIRDYLHWEEDDEAQLIVKPKLLIYQRCVKLVETLPMLRTDENNVEDTADDGDLDTWFDAFKMGFMTLYSPSRPKERKEYKNEEEYVKETIFRKIQLRASHPQGNSQAI
jgi:hypothetical protein